MARRIGYRLLEARSLSTLAGIDLDGGRFDLARQRAQQALAMHCANGQRHDRAYTLVTLGHAVRHTGAPDVAAGCWKEALALFAEFGSPEADHVRDLLRTEAPPPTTTRIAAGTADR